jgi:maltooligosyltrehalose synthase
VVVLAARLSSRRTGGTRPWAVGDVWGADRLRVPRSGRWRDALTGRVLEAKGRAVQVAEALADLPVALLVREA